MHLSELTNHQINTLTALLQDLPTSKPTTQTQRITSLLSKLPTGSPLKRSSRISSLFSSSSSQSRPNSSITTDTPLCPLHRPLSLKVVASLFHTLVLEVGSHLNTLTLHSTSLTATEKSRVSALRELHSLWLPPEIYSSTFLALPNTKQWPYFPNQCQACILSQISGDLPALLSLRMILLSRTSTHTHKNSRKPPRLTPYITHWIAHLSTALSLSSAEFEALISTNDADANALKTTRKQLWRKKRESRRVLEESESEQMRRRRRRETHTTTMKRPAKVDRRSIGMGTAVVRNSKTEAETSTEPQAPPIGVSAASSSTHQSSLLLDEDSSSDSPEDNPTPNIDTYAYLTSPAYLSTLSLPPSLASTVSLPNHIRPYIFPITLTTHSNTDIGLTNRKPIPTRPPPTNFHNVVSPPPITQMETLTLPPMNNNHPLHSPSIYSPLTSPTNRDSYMPPRFPHHTAYLPPDAASLARRYQNLLSPNGLSRDESQILPSYYGSDSHRDSLSEKELQRIPETPGLPRRSSRRISRPDTDFSSCTSSMRRSQSTHSHPSSGSRISSITSMSAGSRYSASLKPGPLSVSSSAGSVRLGVEKGEIGEEEKEEYAPESNAGKGRRMSGAQTVWISVSGSEKARERGRAWRDLEGRGRGDGERCDRGSVDTRWSDVLGCFEEEEEGEGR